MSKGEKPDLSEIVDIELSTRKEVFNDGSAYRLPYVFDRGTLLEWLMIEKPSSAEAYSVQQTGPGQLDKWKAFNGRSDCFFSYPQQQSSRIPILITHQFLHRPYFNKNILAILSRLVEECDLFLYEGPDKPLHQSSPVRSLEQLLDGLEQVKVAPLSKVLEDKQISNKKWGMILDFYKYQELLGNQNPSHELDLTKIGPLTEEENDILLASIESEKMTTVTVDESCLEQLEYLLPHLPAVTLVKIKFEEGGIVFKEAYSKYKDYFKNYPKIEFTLSFVDNSDKDSDANSFRFANVELRSLSDYEKLLAAGKANQVTRLEITASQIKEENRWFYPHNCAEILAKFPYLRSLSLCLPTKEDETFVLPDLPQLEHLSVWGGKITIRHCPSLYYLRLDYTKAQSDFALSALKFAQIDYSHIIGSFSHFSKTAEYLELDFISFSEPPVDDCFNTGDQLKYLRYNEMKQGSGITSRHFRSITTGKKLRNLETKTNEKIHIDSKASTQLHVVSQLNLKGESFEEISDEKPPLTTSIQSKIGLSRFNLSANLTGSAPGGKIGIFSGKGEFSAELKQGNAKKISVGNYRISCFDQVSFDEKNDSVTFHQVIPTKNAKSYLAKPIAERKISGDSKKIDSGTFTGTLQVGQYYPLPLTGSLRDSDFFSCYYKNLPPDLKIEVIRDNGSCFVRAFNASTSKRTRVKVNLEYDFAHNPDYENKASFDPADLPAEKNLPPSLQRKLQTDLKKIDALEFIFDSKLDKSGKIEKLIQFCRFTKLKLDEKSKEKTKDGTLKQYLAIIKHRCGVCAQRSEVFMLLAKFIGVDVQLVTNEVHEFCDIRIKNGSLRRIDFGGGEGRDAASYNRDPAQIRGYGLNTPTPKPSTQGAFFDSKHRPPVPMVSQYEARIRSRMERHYPAFTWETCKTQKKPPLIFLPKNTNMDTVRRDYFDRRQLPKDAKGHSKAFFFIDQPDDFTRSLTAYRVGEDYKRGKTAGPLQQVLDQGGILLVNWSKFSPEQQSFYRDWLDQARDKILGKDLQIVGLISDSVTCSCEFHSRHTACQLPELPTAETKKSSSISQDLKPDRVDLFKAPDWYEKLVASLTFNEEGQKIEDEQLLKSIKNNHSLVIHRPSDPFQDLERQIQIEQRFWFNAEWIEIPDTVNITTSAEPLVPSEKIPVLSQAKSGAIGKRIFLHRNNWHTLYEQVVYDEKSGKPLSTPGKLKQVADQKSEDQPIFYITESISDEEWEQLALYIGKQYPEDSLQFQLAPGVSGPEYFAKQPTPTPDLPIDFRDLMRNISKDIGKNRCFRTNDPAFLTAAICSLYSASQQPLVIDLTPAMGVSELLVREVIDKEKTQDSELSFKVEKEALFSALEKGQTVIIQGTAPARLIQELAPLFSDNPDDHYLEFNGRLVPIKKGQVILVQPENAPVLSASLIPEVSCHITTQDYQDRLTSRKIEEDEKEGKATLEAKIVKKLLLFFAAAEYPHRGDAMPADLGMNWVRLQAMKEALLTPKTAASHQHNPIKNLMLNNYVKGGDDEYYEFLNVVCKYLFDDNSQHPIRTAKFNKKLAKGHPQPGNSLWYFLNTCNGATLREILGEEWVKPSTPLFDCWKNVSRWHEIWDALQKKVEHVTKVEMEAEVKAASVEISLMHKMQKRLLYLIEEDPNSKVIVLRGDPGVGKTHFLNELANNPKYQCFVGNVKPEEPVAVDNLEEWLKAAEKNPDKLLLFLADELNTAKPGMLDMLNGIHRDPAGILYNKHFYKLNPQKHKIVAAVNPEYFSGRYRHELLQKGHSEVLRMPDAADIEQWLLDTYSELKIDTPLAKGIIAGADLFKKYQPLDGYSFRDLQNLMARYSLLQDEAKKSGFTSSQKKIMYAAFQGEFGLRITDLEKRQQFMATVSSILELPPPASTTEGKDFSIDRQLFPADMRDAHEAIRQALLIHKQVCATKSAAKFTYKRGIILQGASHHYEFALCDAMLKQHGLTYVRVSAIDPDFNEKVKQAFNEGKILLIENMQALSSDKESLLGSLLTGKCDNLPAKKPGFLALGIKTVGAHVKSGSLSPALCNRTQFISIPASQAYWFNLAKQKLPELRARTFVQAYMNLKESCQLTVPEFFRHLQQEIDLFERENHELAQEIKTTTETLKKYIENRHTEQETSRMQRVLDSRFFPRLKGYSFLQKTQAMQKLIDSLSGENKDEFTIQELTILLNSRTKNNIKEIKLEPLIKKMQTIFPARAKLIQPLIDEKERQKILAKASSDNDLPIIGI